MVAVSGIGSGLDIDGLVRGLVNAERAPAESRFARQQAGITNLISGFGALKGALSELQSGLSGVRNTEIYGQLRATSSNSGAISVSAGPAASAGTYDVSVSRLAITQSFASGTFASTDTVVGSGTLTLSFGTPTYATDPALDPNTSYTAFAADPDGTPVDIVIDATNNTLEGVKNAINEANAGVSASIIKDGDQFRLLLTTEDTGRSNSLSVAVTEDPLTPGLSALAYNDTTANLVQTRAAEDAAFSINGFAVSSASNTVSDAIDGVTLTLKEVTTSPATIAVSENRSAVISAVEKFIEGYNGFRTTLSNLTAFNQDANTRGPLQGDFTARSVDRQIRAELNTQTSGITSAFNTLAAIGITTSADGKLALDKDALNAAMDADPDAVKALFADTDYQGNAVNGVASRLNTVVEDLLASDGLIRSREDGLEQRTDRINDARGALNSRLEKLEERYRAQFNAMDALVANISSTGDFLQQQLQNLPGYFDGSRR